MSKDIRNSLSLNDICQELGLLPQFLTDLAECVESHYHSFERIKRSGGTRQISASKGKLKRVQRLLLDEFFVSFKMPAHVHGCVKKRSIATNAEPHVGRDVVINLDLCKFFHTVSVDMVNGVFAREFLCDEQAAELFSRLTTLSGHLPQGAPTSPFLANICALPLDAALMDCCAKGVGAGNFKYTRYVDDITISGALALVDLLPALDRLINESGFKTNQDKTKVLRQSTRQWVTGVVVNKQLAPPKKVLRDLRQHMYYCRRYGLEGHCDWLNTKPRRFLSKIKGAIGYVRVTQPELADLLDLQLSEIAPKQTKSKDEYKLNAIKRAIDNEWTVDFRYDRVSSVGLFSEIVIDENGSIKVHGYELSPERGQKTYFFSGLKRVKARRSLT
jgi:RNA-directed DNA polymerase